MSVEIRLIKQNTKSSHARNDRISMTPTSLGVAETLCFVLSLRAFVRISVLSVLSINGCSPYLSRCGMR